MPTPERGDGGRLRTLLILTLATALVLAGAWVLTRKDAVAATSSATVAAGAAPAVGRPLPDLTATAIDGKPVSLAALRGHPVWLTFGATWCQPCRAEAPDLQAAYAAHQPKGLAMVAVYMSEDAASVKNYSSLLGLGYTHVPDPQARVAASFGVNSIPVHLFVNADGVLVSRREGALGRDAIDAELAAIGA